jgi:hypothetical protein
MMILIGVTQLSALTRQAVVAGHDGTVINDVWSSQRLLTLGIGGSRLASALIERGQETLIVSSDKRSSTIDGPKYRRLAKLVTANLQQSATPLPL